MKQLFFGFSLLANLLLGQSSSCNVSALIPDVVFYPGVSSTPSYTPWAQYYLCDSAIVYDTLLGGDLQIFINPGAIYYWKGGERRSSTIWIKNGGTLNLIATGNYSSRIVYMEPGASLIDPSNLMSMFAGTIACTSISFPAINCFTGINEINKNNFASKLFPNPNNGSFKLQIDSEIEKGELILMNSLGQKVHEQKISRGVNDINTSGLAIGLYHYILFENKMRIKNGKIAIE